MRVTQVDITKELLNLNFKDNFEEVDIVQGVQIHKSELKDVEFTLNINGEIHSLMVDMTAETKSNYIMHIDIEDESQVFEASIIYEKFDMFDSGGDISDIDIIYDLELIEKSLL